MNDPSTSPSHHGETPVTDQHPRPGLSRRRFLTGGAGMAAMIAGSHLIGGSVASASVNAAAAAVAHPRKDLHLAGTDGWVAMPASAPADPPFFPDTYAPNSQNTYVFGFRDVTGLTAAQVSAQRGKAQI